MNDTLNLTHDELAALLIRDPKVAKEYVQTRDDLNELARKQMSRIEHIRTTILSTKTSHRIQENVSKRSSGTTQANTLKG